MKKQPYQNELDAIRLLQERSNSIARQHDVIGDDLDDIKKQLAALVADTPVDKTELALEIEKQAKRPHTQFSPLPPHSLSDIYHEASTRFMGETTFGHILSEDDLLATSRRINQHVEAFNREYNLDGWDYAIGGSCGLIAAMIDLLCVKAPPKPTTKWTEKVDGVFNLWVQEAFNKALPPELSKLLSEKYKIGAPDTSVTNKLVDAYGKVLNPVNHRLRSLSHDPILGVIFGVMDMLRGTCTVVHNGAIVSYPSSVPSPDGTIFELIGRMIGHLFSDVNAPSKNGNRGMGLPAPFMGLLRMIEGIPIGDSNFGKQVEYMYVNGYDFRQFVVTSIPMMIMEILLRVFFIAKQMNVYGLSFCEATMQTMPTKMHPRFRMILAMAYGTSSAVNAGKIYVTKNLLNLNYASWMGLVWNGFHAFKWALHDRHVKMWDGITEKEIARIEQLGQNLDGLIVRADSLPT